MIFGEIARLYCIIQVFLRFGLDELIPKLRSTLALRIGRHLFFWLTNQHPDKSLAERIRLALQALGPVWIKFGQMLSTRRDLLPVDIADQLALLQDQVEPFDSQIARQQIEAALGGALENWFDEFDPTPLASASIAQVHTARLKQGQEVVLKVIRPNIRPVITADIRLMRCLASWLPKILPDGRRLRPTEVVKEYEKSLLNELNLLREAANAIQLRRNFDNSELLYIPEVYPSYCHENLLVMERIHGIPIADMTTLKKKQVDMKLLAERGVQVFFTQVFRDSFFHADMHPGNIFVSEEHPHDPQYIAIDFGIVGALNKEDKRYLAENFIAFFNRNYRKVAELHVDSGWVPAETNLEDFESAIRTVCEPIFEKPLAEISFAHVLLNLFNTARQFNMQVQPQLVLLQKTLLYVEGLGRQLYPQLDLWSTAKPFLESWLRSQVGVAALFATLKEKAPYWTEKLPDLPDLVYDSLRQHKRLKQHIEQLGIQLQQQQAAQHKHQYFLGIGATLVLSGILLLSMHVKLASIICGLSGVLFWLIGWRRIERK